MQIALCRSPEDWGVWHQQCRLPCWIWWAEAKLRCLGLYHSWCCTKHGQCTTTWSFGESQVPTYFLVKNSWWWWFQFSKKDTHKFTSLPWEDDPFWLFCTYFSFMGWWVQPPKACFQPGSWSHAPFAKTKQGSYDRCGGQAFNCRQGNLDVFGNPSFWGDFYTFYPRTYGSSGKLP